MDDLPREVDLESDSEEIRSYNSTASESLPEAPDADLSSTLAESPCVIKRKGGRKPVRWHLPVLQPPLLITSPQDIRDIRRAETA